MARLRRLLAAAGRAAGRLALRGARLALLAGATGLVLLLLDALLLEDRPRNAER